MASSAAPEGMTKQEFVGDYIMHHVQDADKWGIGGWYLYLPEHGSMFLQQRENYWTFLRDVAFPAWRSSANSWRGSWLGNLTAGPGALGTAAVSGGSGRVDGLEMIGLESMAVRAFSSETGLLSADGRLMIEMPQRPEEVDQ